MTAASSGEVFSNLTRELRAAADAMGTYTSDEIPALRPLHHLQRWCDTMLTETAMDIDAVVPLYLLSRLLDDALENLTGDPLYDPTAYKLKTAFVRTLTDDISKLSTSGFSDPPTWLSLVGHAITTYLDVLDQLNAHAEAQVAPNDEEGL